MGDDQPYNEALSKFTQLPGSDASSVTALLPAIYDELRALAGSFFRGRSEQTLQPTALVHEAFLKIVGSSSARWENRAHFFALAAQVMRQVLADHARQRRADKRRGPEDAAEASFLIGLRAQDTDACVDVVALDAALAKLAELDPRQSQIVELRFLAGMTVEEVAKYLDVSGRTVEREWRAAKAWLRHELEAGSND